jgi:hypothetical protein
MRLTVFWGVASCSLVEIALMMKAASTSETSISFYETTRRNIPEDSRLDICLFLSARRIYFQDNPSGRVLATGPKVRGSKPGRGRWIFKGDKNP